MAKDSRFRQLCGGNVYDSPVTTGVGVTAETKNSKNSVRLPLFERGVGSDFYVLTILSDGRRRAYNYKQLINRDTASLDIFWLRDESLEDCENLPDPDVLAQEIVDDLEAALEQFREIASDLDVDRGETKKEWGLLTGRESFLRKPFPKEFRPLCRKGF